MLTPRPADILHFLRACEDGGQAAALVTLAGIAGSSPRAIGSQMAVAEDGRYMGSLSGGCVEAAIVAEALDALADGAARCVRFGAGSPYIDIRLPCGSGIDLWFTPRPDRAAIAEALALIGAHRPAALYISPDGMIRRADPGRCGREGEGLVVAYAPSLHILAAGQGEDLVATVRLARFFGAGITVLTPDAPTIAMLSEGGVEVVRLTTAALPASIASDPWTAVIYLFHDPDWEETLLPRLLALSGFYHGAVGSRRAQARRMDMLRAAQVPDVLLGRLRGPLGMIAGARDPATLALSILSEVVQDYRDHVVGAVCPEASVTLEAAAS